jgi:hypothetical protein
VPAGWQGFTFANPTSPFQQNFNAIAAKDPKAAFAYGMNNGINSAGDINSFTQQLNAKYGNGTGQAIMGMINGQGGDTGLSQSLGVQDASAWNPYGRAGSQAKGNTYTVNGQTFTLPNVAGTRPAFDPAAAQAAAARTATNGPGTSAWWAAVNGLQGK